MTIISIVAKANWPIANLISFLEKLQQSVLDAHPILSINDIYDLEISKVMMEEIDYFFPELTGDVTVFSKDYVHDSLARDRFRADVALLLDQYRQSANETFTIEEFIIYNKAVSFEKSLRNKISAIEKKVVDHEEKIKLDKENEIIRAQKVNDILEAAEKKAKDILEAAEKKAKDILEAAEKKAKDTFDAIEKMRRDVAKKKYQEEEDYVNENREYYKRCKYYIVNGYDGYTDDELDIDSEDLTSEEIKETIIEAHQKKNKELVKLHKFPGCHDHGIDCDCDENCTWTVGDHRCSCYNYTGFEFNTEDVDWEKDLTLDSSYFCGTQERQW